MKKIRTLELRATIKTLTEQRNDKVEELQALVETAKLETRAMTEEENIKFESLEAEIKNIDKTIAAETRAKGLEIVRDIKGNKPEEKKTEIEIRAEKEERAFENYIRRSVGMPLETRDDEINLDMTGNQGAIVPTTIANRIITEVKEISPILARATIFRVRGTLKIPVWGASNGHDITVAYGEDFTELTADSGKFTSVDLTGYLAGALTLIGRTVITNGQFDVVSFVITEMAKKIALFLEKELLQGTASKATGILSTTNVLKSGGATVASITADKLIELQSKIPTAYQGDACWIVNPTVFTELKKMKDGEGRYLLEYDFSSGFPYRILGKPVYLSDNMPTVANKSKAVLYGDLSGLAVNIREEVSIQVLLEKYATQHAVGIVSWFEFDSKVMDNQKVAVLSTETA